MNPKQAVLALSSPLTLTPSGAEPHLLNGSEWKEALWSSRSPGPQRAENSGTSLLSCPPALLLRLSAAVTPGP